MDPELAAAIKRLAERVDDPTKKELVSLLRGTLNGMNNLKGQVQALESALNLDKTANVQAAFGVSENLALLLIMLADGKPRNKEVLHAALYFSRPDIDAPEVKIIDTLVCKLRKYVEKHNVSIGTVWGSGYVITNGLDVVRTAIEHARTSA